MTSYGGFGVATTPHLSVLVAMIIEAGITFAMPGIRGGGEYGRPRHEAARGRKRQVGIDDSIAAAEWLSSSRMTRPDRPNGMYYSLGARLEFKDSPSASLSVQRAKGMGPFGEREHLIFATLMPHLRRSLMLHSRLSELQAEALGFEIALDADDSAVLGLDRSGRILLCNRHAHDLVAARNGLYSDEGKLHPFPVPLKTYDETIGMQGRHRNWRGERGAARRSG